MLDAADVKHEVLPQVEIPEKWTQEPPCFAITIGVRLRSHSNHFDPTFPHLIYAYKNQMYTFLVR